MSNPQIVGMSTGRVTSTPKSTQLMGYIMTLGVVSQMRRKGLGTLLLRELIPAMFALGAKRLELDVITSNGVALDLYLAHGFVVSHVERMYYFIDGQFHDSYHLVYDEPRRADEAKDESEPVPPVPSIRSSRQRRRQMVYS